TATRVTTGKRGEIFDVSGNLLVGNAPCINVVADPSLVKNDAQRREISVMMASILKRPREEFYQRLEPTRIMRDAKGNPLRKEDGTVKTRVMREVMLARAVTPEEGAILRKISKERRFNSLFFREDYQRFYPTKGMLANLLGIANRNNENLFTGVTGIEEFCNAQLAGTTGKERYERDRKGRPLTHGLRKQTAYAKNGSNIYLTISEPIQAILEEELDDAYEKWSPKAIYAIVVNPKNGDVLAMGQRPSFDPNDRSNIHPEDWRLRIAEDGMEPGSIIKPFTVAGALDAGKVTPNSRFDCEMGTWYYLGKPLRDTHDYGMMTVADIIKTSSNIGTAKIALECGPDLLYRTLRSFGFGSKSGLPVRIEATGILPKVKNWDGLSITRFSIGYGILVSPVQMVRGYCALANNGWLPKLRLIDREEDPVTGTVTVMPREEPVQLFHRPETAKEIVTMMKAVTGEGGTARRAAIKGYSVAGKTGTSRKYVPGKGYTLKYFASFVGFVPADNPELVILVTTDEPKGGSYGGTVSGPTFRKIAERILKHLQIPPDMIPEEGSEP
ncbi:MAG: penicillin-binding protein 2, partial [Lentisphaeria bacterium]|nr:penicillin-binding protein 2 [Lentisphaeria bacterium]